MNLDIIRNYSPSYTQIFREQIGTLGHRVVKLFNQALESVQDKRIAGTIVLAANLVFVRITLAILVYTLEKFYDSKKIQNYLGENGELALLLSLTGAIAISSTTIMNVALSRLLRLPLNPWVTGGIATSVSVGQFAYWFFSDQK